MRVLRMGRRIKEEEGEDLSMKNVFYDFIRSSSMPGAESGLQIQG